MSRLPVRSRFRQMTASLAWLTIDRGVRLVGGFLVGLWLARYLGPGDFGLLSTGAVIAWFGVVITQLGLDGIVQRETVRRPGEVGRIIGTSVVLSLATSLIAWFGLMIYARFLIDDPRERAVLISSSLIVVPSALAAWEYLFQARSRLRPVVLIQTSSFVVCLLLRAGLIAAGAPVVAFALVFVADRLIAATFVAWYGQVGSGWPRLSFDPTLAKTMLREAAPVLGSILLITCYMKCDQILLLRWNGPAAAGEYSAAMRLTDVWWSMATITATAVLPVLVQIRAQSEPRYLRCLQGYLDLSAAVAILAAILMSMLAGPLVHFLFGAAYARTAPILVLHFWSGVAVFLSVARTRHLIAIGRRRAELWFALIGVTMNLGLNSILIPRHGAIGAAWAALVSQTSMALFVPWLFTDTQQIARLTWAALFFPLRTRDHWRLLRTGLVRPGS